MSKARCAAAVKVTDTGWEKARACDGRGVDMEPYMSSLHEDFLVGLKNIEMKPK